MRWFAMTAALNVRVVMKVIIVQNIVVELNALMGYLTATAHR
jgi:hypothetical protein